MHIQPLSANECGVCLSLMHLAAPILLTPSANKQDKLLCMTSCCQVVCLSYLYPLPTEAEVYSFTNMSQVASVQALMLTVITFIPI